MIISMALNQTGRIDVVFNATAPLVKESGPGKHAADLTTKEFMVPLTTIVKSNFIKAHAGVQCRSLGLAEAAQRLRARRFALAQYLKLPHVVVETGRDLGGPTNSRRPSPGSAWREAPCCPQRSILFGGNIRSCRHGPSSHCATKAAEDCAAAQRRFSGTAKRNQAIPLFHDVASAFE
jgi:hypothetical protein